jgi:glycosyltransferase involved in cell wall biosynthesis
VSVASPLRRAAAQARRRGVTERDARLARFRQADLSIFHDFEPSPAGGANQTLSAFVAECERRGLRVERNTISRTTRACLFNSFNFDFDRLQRFARSRPGSCRMVHRVGAVTTLYRGFDDGTDARVAELNRTLADATLAISQATIDMYRQIGVELVDPHVVHNPVDRRIFNADGREPLRRDRKTRLIAVSWSPNPRKGGPTYRWLEEHLDSDRYELTFVGNPDAPYSRARTVGPVPSHELADLLRSHDIFVTATENDAYSNALVEALACGLPALYLRSGGSAEAVGDAGFGFDRREEIPGLLERLAREYAERQAAISLPTLEELVDGYLEVLGLG